MTIVPVMSTHSVLLKVCAFFYWFIIIPAASYTYGRVNQSPPHSVRLFLNWQNNSGRKVMTIVPVMSTHYVLLKVCAPFYLGDNCIQSFHLGR